MLYVYFSLIFFFIVHNSFTIGYDFFDRVKKRYGIDLTDRQLPKALEKPWIRGKEPNKTEVTSDVKGS
jgi:hypothetical protein